MMIFNEHHRESVVTLSPSPSLRSGLRPTSLEGNLREGSGSLGREMRRCAQHDIPGFGRENSLCQPSRPESRAYVAVCQEIDQDNNRNDHAQHDTQYRWMRSEEFKEMPQQTEHLKSHRQPEGPTL
jgi:hypothetical protein